MSRLSFTTGLVSLAALAVLSCAPLASAEDASASQVRVQTGNVDFTNPKQVAHLYKQIKAAAQYVCDVQTSYNFDDDVDPATVPACEADAVSGAVRDIHQTSLSMLDDRNNGRADAEFAYNMPKH